MEDQEYAALQDLGGRLDTLIDDAEELRSDLGEARISLSRLLRSGAGAGPPADDPGTDPPDAGERWEIKLGAKDIEIEADTLRHFDYLGTLFSLYVETVGGDATLWLCRTTRPARSRSATWSWSFTGTTPRSTSWKRRASRERSCSARSASGRGACWAPGQPHPSRCTQQARRGGRRGPLGGGRGTCALLGAAGR